MNQKSTTSVKESKHHTLKKFASEHFRPSMKAVLATNSGISTPKSCISEELWKHTREPIKAPLLAKLASKDEQFKLAKQIFTNILRYMGDLPSNKQRISTEYTDKIFEQPLRDVSNYFFLSACVKFNSASVCVRKLPRKHSRTLQYFFAIRSSQLARKCQFTMQMR